MPVMAIVGETMPVMAITKPSENLLIGRATSSALVKQIADNGEAYVVSSEIYDALSKLLKSDDETASGDIQLLCKLFFGERATYHYSTEKVCEIPPKLPSPSSVRPKYKMRQNRSREWTMVTDL